MIKFMILWSLLYGAPGNHGSWNRPIRRLAIEAVRNARADGLTPTHVACSLYCPDPETRSEWDHEDVLSCQAGAGAASAMTRLAHATLMAPDPRWDR